MSAAAAGVALACVAFAVSFLVVTQISGGAEPEPERNVAPSAAGALSSAQEEVPGVRPAAPVPALRRAKPRKPRKRRQTAPARDRQSPAQESVPDEPTPSPAPAPDLSPAPAPKPKPKPAPAPEPPPPVRFYDEG